MKMKLSIAAALSHRPKLLILDEATSGLDPVMRDDILEIFAGFVKEEGRSILMSSHITTDLEKVADYITFIHRGRVIFSKRKSVDGLLFFAAAGFFCIRFHFSLYVNIYVSIYFSICLIFCISLCLVLREIWRAKLKKVEY